MHGWSRHAFGAPVCLAQVELCVSAVRDRGSRAARSQTAGLKTAQSWSGLRGALQSLRTGFYTLGEPL